MLKMRIIYPVILLSFVTLAKAVTYDVDIAAEEASSYQVDLRNENIQISGSNYTTRSKDTIHFQRFSDAVLSLGQLESKINPVRAHTTTGIVIKFNTSSPYLQLKFTVEEGENRGHKYAVFQNGELTGEYSFSKTDGPDLLLNFSSANPGTDVLYEITMPNWSITALTGLALEEDYGLTPINEQAKPVYVAYGNSITHGTGQNGTHKTYPHLLAEQLDLDLYNVAVGGAKTSVIVAEMLRDDFGEIDYMTMLIGYNDYNGEGITTEEYYNRYLSFLRTFREKHQNTVIYCLTMTYTTTAVSAKTGITADEFRQVAIDIVELLKGEGDENIHLIHGDSISSDVNLNDAVHFSEPGAALFADALADEMEKKSPIFGIEASTPIRQIVSELYPDGNLLIGSACHENLLGTPTETILDREFSYVTPANDFKQSYIHPEPGVWRWERSNTWVEHCRQNDQLIRMHAPISPQCSKWVREDNRTAAELELMLEEYMVALCTHYNDTAHIKWLDVVNETLNSDGTWFGPKDGTANWENPWPLIGYDESHELKPPLYIKQAFEFANLHAPDLKLIINQHGGFEEAVWAKMKELVLYLRDLGLKVDGVGWQAHISLGWEKDPSNLTRLSEFIDWCHQNDLEFHITEFNVWLRDGNEGNYEGQADTFYEIVKLVASKHESGIVGVNFWHIRGVETANPDRDGCLWAENYEPKQAYYDVKNALVEIAAGTGPAIISAPQESGVTMEPYTYQVRLRGAIGDPLYELNTEADWLSIDQNGLLSGIPTHPDTIDISIQVSDDLGSQTQNFTMVVYQSSLEITSSPVEYAREGEPYEYQVTYLGEGEFSLQTYMAVTWLTINQDGLLSGTPDMNGTIPIIIKFSNELETVKQEFELVIEEAVFVNNPLDRDIKIYPNPAVDLCFIHHLPIGSEYAVYTATGQEILRTMSISDPELLELNNIQPGRYILRSICFKNEYMDLLIIR